MVSDLNNDREADMSTMLTMIHFSESVNPPIGRGIRKECKCKTES